VVAHSVLVANQGPDDATSVMFLGALPSSAEVSSMQTTAGQCRISDDGVTCALGDLLVGERAMVTYIAKTDLPGSLTTGATVFGNEWDPAWTNNSAVTTAQVR
jgi:hypothetical protein